MPKLMDVAMEDLNTASNYGFSATKIDDLGASQYTLVTIAVDVSSSVGGFEGELERCLKQILESCQKSPMSENLMLRLVSFNHDVEEIHGFKMLSAVNDSDYTDILHPHGGTALYDATYTSIDAVKSYGAILFAQEYLANGIVFVVTDGDNTSGTRTSNGVGTLIKAVQRDETSLDSLCVVLIGINTDDTYIRDCLTQFQTEAGIDKYINAGDATPSQLAKLADWISQSISSTSQALGTGRPSSLLAF